MSIPHLKIRVILNKQIEEYRFTTDNPTESQITIKLNELVAKFPIGSKNLIVQTGR